jgi:hypothetical protein
MAYSVHLRLRGDLLGVARVIRLLRRYAVTAAEVAIERLSGHEITSMHGTLTLGHRAKGLAAALGRSPGVMSAVILDESRVIAEFSRPFAGR